MIRSIGNTPAPTPAPAPAPIPEPEQKLRRYNAEEPTPAPAPEEPQTSTGNNLAFKGVLVKNFPKDTAMTKFFDFLDLNGKLISQRPRIEIPNDKIFTIGFAENSFLLQGKTKDAEEILYKNLNKNKEMISGVEIHKVNDWA